MDTLEKRQNAELVEVKAQNAELKGQITELKSQITELKGQITELKRQNADLDTKMDAVSRLMQYPQLIFCDKSIKITCQIATPA